MKVSVMLNAERFMGNHGEVRMSAIELEPNETVEHLVERLLAETKPSYDKETKKSVRIFDRWLFTDHIELRVVKEA